jgi:UPF0755 protein
MHWSKTAVRRKDSLVLKGSGDSMTSERPRKPTVSARGEQRPRSPSEALEPGRAPQRPKSIKVKAKKERKPVPGLVRVVSGLLSVGLVALLATAGGAALLKSHFDRPGPLTAQKSIAIPQGDGVIAIADRLASEGVIASQWAFVTNFKARRILGGKQAPLKHGEYVFKAGMSMREVLEVITDGKGIQYKVTVPEGLTTVQILERLKANANLDGDVEGPPPEGSVLPETYAVTKGMARADVISKMQAAMKQTVQAAWDKRAADLPIKTPEEAVVLASIVEKETGRADERPKIAGVFINRLRKNMRLQSDPTILYGLYGGAVQWGKPILQSEIDAKNAHNTYKINGLPPTPICNPGKAAIEAVLNPEPTSNLYFVADGTGGHTFSETLKEHNEAAAEWRKTEKDIRKKQSETDGPEAAATTAQPAAADAAPAAPASATAAGAAPAGSSAIPAVSMVNGKPPATAAAIPNPVTEQTPAAAKPAEKSAAGIPPPVRKPKQ